MRFVVRYAQSTLESFSTHFSFFALPQTVKNGVIAYLSFTIALWIVWCWELMSDLVLGPEGSHLFIGDISPVIGDDSMQEAEATYQILP